MLYYKEDKLLSRPFSEIWQAIENLLELAQSGTRDPEQVILWDERGDAPVERLANALNDGQAMVNSLYHEARLLSQHPNVRAYIRWNPIFGTGTMPEVGHHLSRQLTIVEQPFHGKTWAFIYLLTAFSPDDPRWPEFLNDTERLVKFSLLPQHWRTVEFTKAGKPRLRKLPRGGELGAAPDVEPHRVSPECATLLLRFNAGER